MANMEERLQAVVSQAETDGKKWHNIVHGDENTTVTTENGDVPTVAKQLKDIRDTITGGVSDVVAEAESARDTTLIYKNDVELIKSEVEQLKSDTEELKNTTESYKNMAQTTFNSVSSAVNQGISDIQTETQNQLCIVQSEGNTQVTLVQSATAEQIQLASNQADRAEVAANTAINATDNKINLDLSNMSQIAISQIVQWLCPDWTRKQTLSLNTNVTITERGWVLMRNTTYTSNINGYINGNLVLTQCGAYGEWQEWNSLSFLVDVGDVVKLTGGELAFMPCKGINNAE
ncbi:MAG: hypothetical protein IJX20_00700 [Alphaproteobacteria bacterium]|nr:hypothetical protein [Alphaproteobacteria bacterium]